MKKFNLKREKRKLWLRTHKWQIIKSTSLVICSVILTIAVMYFSKANFSTRVTFDVIDARVAPFSNGDVILTYNIDGVDSNTIMENDGTTYRLSNYTCDNQEEVEWDEENWKIIIGNMSGKVKCKLYFEAVIKITFDANGGSVSPTSIYFDLNGGTISNLPTPTRSKYTFKGWYTASSGGSEITALTTFNSSQTIYARWEAGCYRINGNFEAHYNLSGQMDTCYYTGCGSSGCSSIGTAKTYLNGAGTSCDKGLFMCTLASNSIAPLYSYCNNNLPGDNVWGGGMSSTYTCP